MRLRVVGAGLPRTGTTSLKHALEHLLGAPCYHMSVIPTHPFELGAAWNQALAGQRPDWDQLLAGYAATVDWPASMFWRELSEANPEALVLLSVRETPETWWRSFDEMVLQYTRLSLAPDWTEGKGLLNLMERFTGTPEWDDADKLKALYLEHNAKVRRTIQQSRLLEWRPEEGWTRICRALGLPVPAIPFPRIDGRPSPTGSGTS